MTSAELLLDGFGRIEGVVHGAVDGLTPEQLTYRIEPDANTIAWLVWHLTRIQDDHIADAFDLDQVWTADGWADRFGLPFAAGATGYGHSSADVAKVAVDGALLTGYHEAVHRQTAAAVRGVVDKDLTRIVDESWDPPVSLGVRLISVISDGLQHAGQAAFVRGVLSRMDRR